MGACRTEEESARGKREPLPLSGRWSICSASYGRVCLFANQLLAVIDQPVQQLVEGLALVDGEAGEDLLLGTVFDRPELGQDLFGLSGGININILGILLF